MIEKVLNIFLRSEERRVGKIGVMDADVVDMTNLQRQVLYKVEDIGNPKATTAANRLTQMNDMIDEYHGATKSQ